MISYYTATRNSHRWYKILTTHIIEEGILNAFLLSKYQGQKRSHYDFIRITMKALLMEGMQEQAADNQPGIASSVVPASDTLVAVAAAAAAAASTIPPCNDPVFPHAMIQYSPMQ